MTRAVVIAAVAILGCGGGDDVTFVADAALADDGAIDCSQVPLSFVRCEDAAGMPCTGADGEVQSFLPISPGDPMAIVLGPQGSDMFVFALRVSGIDPGDGGENNPATQLLVHLGDTEIGGYLSRPNYTDSGGEYTSQGLFVVIIGPSDGLVGQTLTASAQVTDRNGGFRCGSIEFQAALPN
jgi:hypothetical protein